MVSGGNHMLHVFLGFSVHTIGVGRIRKNLLENSRANRKFKHLIEITLKQRIKQSRILKLISKPIKRQIDKNW